MRSKKCNEQCSWKCAKCDHCDGRTPESHCWQTCLYMYILWEFSVALRYVALQIVDRVQVQPRPVHIYAVTQTQQVWVHSDTTGYFDIIDVAAAGSLNSTVLVSSSTRLPTYSQIGPACCNLTSAQLAGVRGTPASCRYCLGCLMISAWVLSTTKKIKGGVLLFHPLVPQSAAGYSDGVPSMSTSPFLS